MKIYVYGCLNTRCRACSTERPTHVSPADNRARTGRSVTCGPCGQPMRLLRVESEPQAVAALRPTEKVRVEGERA
ncbi:MAG: hypothetical protein ACRD3I_05640 [Terriglobales bacterium]